MGVLRPAQRLGRVGRSAHPADPGHTASGDIAVAEATGAVFVLLPGGPFAMGAQARDPLGPNYDAEAPGFVGPVQTVDLSPFLIARRV